MAARTCKWGSISATRQTKDLAAVLKVGNVRVFTAIPTTNGGASADGTTPGTLVVAWRGRQRRAYRGRIGVFAGTSYTKAAGTRRLTGGAYLGELVFSPAAPKGTKPSSSYDGLNYTTLPVSAAQIATIAPDSNVAKLAFTARANEPFEIHEVVLNYTG